MGRGEGAHILDELGMVSSLHGRGANFIATRDLGDVHWQVQRAALGASVPVASPARPI